MVHIASKPFLRKRLQPRKHRGSSQSTEFTPVPPTGGQNFPRYLDEHLEFFVVFKNLYVFFARFLVEFLMIFCGTLVGNRQVGGTPSPENILNELELHLPPSKQLRPFLSQPSKFHTLIFYFLKNYFNPLKTKCRLPYLRPSSYRTVNTFHLGYKNQSVYAVSGTSRCLFSDIYKTHKYSVGRMQSC